MRQAIVGCVSAFSKPFLAFGSGRRRSRPGLVATAAASGLAVLSAAILAPAQSASAASFVPISGAGSTWSYNAINDWITNVTQQGMVVNYQPVGSTSGRQEFADGVADWAASDIPYGLQDGNISDPLPARGFTYVPDTAGGIALMYNLTIGGVRVTNLRLSGAVIAGIFTGQITVWNDPKIAADNPGLSLPALGIVPVVRTDGSGATWQFTQWMSATQASSWTAYCAVVGRSPCTPTSAYPVDPSSAMIGQAGDLGVTGYVSQPTADGAIGYVEYSYALSTGFPVAKVLNAAGYYTLPTPDNVGVSLLQAQINSNPSDPLYQTENLSQVYTDTDPRTYELSFYSYMIVPTTSAAPMTTAKGYTLGAFGQYLLCQGQQQVNGLGYAALPINLVEAGFTQLQKVPGNALPATTAAQLGSCNNPTFAPDGTNLLARNAPNPPACDQQGPTQCTTTATSGQVATTATLTASPDPATVGATVTLTATESAADGTTPGGTVQFGVGGSDIGAPVAVSAAGVAITTTTFAGSGAEPLWALFLPASLTYATSEGTLSLPVVGTAGTVLIGVTVPASGALMVTVAAGAVDLVEQGTTPPATATGTLSDVTVTDTRNTYPGWSVSGQVSSFTSGGSGATIPGDQLGWTPTPVGPLAGGATVGPTVAPGTSPNGLGDTAALLASAPSGQGLGTNTLSAGLVLDIPAATPAGLYSSLLTVTYLGSGP